MKRISIALVLSFLALSPIDASAAGIPGSKCTQSGKTQIVKKLTYTCVVVRGKKVWSKGVDMTAIKAAAELARIERERIAAENKARVELEKKLLPTKPFLTTLDVDKGPGMIRVTWEGLNSSREAMGEYDHVGLFVTDLTGTFSDGTKELWSFTASGTAYIYVPGGEYKVKLTSFLKDGTMGMSSAEISVGKVDAAPIIDLPTLPTGFSASPVAFAIVAKWNGSYVSKSFAGFSRVEIYATCTDMGISSSDSTYFQGKKVGSMTVNEVPNAITVGLSALRGACGLTGSEVYSRKFYFYQIAVNVSNKGYSVDGKLTWTRFESASSTPSQ